MFSTYEREFIAIIYVVHKWIHYLLDHHFIIKNDHESVKYLLENKLATPFQKRWVSKLLSFEYEIQYNKEAKNKVIDALSRVTSSELLHMLLASVSSNLIDLIKEA